MSPRWPRPLFYLTFIAVLVVDQLTKMWALASLRPLGSIQIVPGFFNLTFVRNEGIAFGMFQGQGLLIGLFMIIFVGVAIYYTRSLNWTLWEPNLIGGGLCGGAIGNLLDRFRLGYVVDFFDAYAGPHHWPVFNVADSAICVAVGWIVFRQLVSSPAKAPHKA